MYFCNLANGVSNICQNPGKIPHKDFSLFSLDVYDLVVYVQRVTPLYFSGKKCYLSSKLSSCLLSDNMGHLVKCGTAGVRGAGVITGKMRRKSVGIIVRGLGQLRAAYGRD